MHQVCGTTMDPKVMSVAFQFMDSVLTAMIMHSSIVL